MNLSGKKFTLTCIAAATMAGCSTVPERNAAFEQAEAQVQAAKTNPLVVEHAPAKLGEAERDLANAKLLWNEKKSTRDIEFYSYLAERKALTAESLAEYAVAREQIRKSGAERDRILLDARARQLSLAESEAALARSEAAVAATQAAVNAEEAATARREAELARQEAARKAAELESKSAELELLRKTVSELQARETERGLVLTLGDVLFDFDKAVLKPGGMSSVSKLAGFLDEYPERQVLIEGFTDSVGSDAYNQQLSERRANAVRDALIGEGVARNRIQTVGYGEAFPVVSNDTEAGRQQNRRVEVIISNQSGVIPERAK